MPPDHPRPESTDSAPRDAPVPGEGADAGRPVSEYVAPERLKWDLVDAVAAVCYLSGSVGAAAWVGGLIDGKTPSAAGKLVYVLIWCAMVLPVVPFVARRWWGAGAAELGIAKPRRGSFRWFAGFALLAGVGYLGLGLLFLAAVRLGLLPFTVRQDIALKSVAANGGVFAMLLAFLVAAPLTEELVFRGVLYPALRTRLGTGWAVLVSAVIFAAIHPLWRWTFFLPVSQFLGGLIFAWSYEKTRTLVYPVVFHVIGNAGVAGWALVAAYRPGWASWIFG